MNENEQGRQQPPQAPPAQCAQPPQAPPAQPQPPQYAPPPKACGAWEAPLSGGAKAGWFALGFLLGLIGVLIAYLVTEDKGPLRKGAALKFALFGTGTIVLVCILFTALTFCAAATTMYAFY